MGKRGSMSKGHVPPHRTSPVRRFPCNQNGVNPCSAIWHGTLDDRLDLGSNVSSVRSFWRCISVNNASTSDNLRPASSRRCKMAFRQNLMLLETAVSARLAVAAYVFAVLRDSLAR
jgi:hypothetical protein